MWAITFHYLNIIPLTKLSNRYRVAYLRYLCPVSIMRIFTRHDSFSLLFSIHSSSCSFSKAGELVWRWLLLVCSLSSESYQSCFFALLALFTHADSHLAAGDTYKPPGAYDRIYQLSRIHLPRRALSARVS